MLKYGACIFYYDDAVCKKLHKALMKGFKKGLNFHGSEYDTHGSLVIKEEVT